MVQGWQRRAEIAVARRVESKQRKQKKSDRANLKGKVAALVAQLDKYPYRQVSDSSVRLHVWTELQTNTSMIGGVGTTSSPCHQRQEPCISENEDSDGLPRNRRGLSSIDDPKTRSPKSSHQHRHHENDQDNHPTGGRKRHSSLRKDNGDMVHNDEHFSSPTCSSRSQGNPQWFCRNQFYKGKCVNVKSSKTGRKSMGCAHLHNQENFKTLAEVLLRPDQSATTVLDTAEAALVETIMDGSEEKEMGGMEVLQYFSIKLYGEENEHSMDPQMTIGQIFNKALRDHSCVSASLVYLACDHVLVFDRHQDGLCVADLAIVFRDIKRKTLTSVIEPLEEDVHVCAVSVPGAVLEYVLAFLPDRAVASMTQVCTSWRNEIGTSSSHLWRYMLSRRKWPIPDLPTLEASENDNMKKHFQMHYQVVRDVNAIRDGISMILHQRRTAPVDEGEMVYQNFSSRRNAPAEPNVCIAMKALSCDEVIAAYSLDCTIRLFKAVVKSPGGGKTCRELISVCMNPFRKTSRRKAHMVAMDTDSDMVGCLLHVEGGANGPASILSVISKDNFLEAAGGYSSSLGWSEVEEGVIVVTDLCKVIRESIVNNSDDVEVIAAHFDRGDEVAEIKVVVSDTLVACGLGRFAVAASIYIPYEDGDWLILDYKMVIVSTALNDVIHMESLPRELGDEGILVALTDLSKHSGRGTCHIAATASSTPSLWISSVKPDGQVSPTMHPVRASAGVVEEFRNSLRPDGQWQVNFKRKRFVAPFESGDIVAVDVFSKLIAEGRRIYRSCISFHHSVNPTARDIGETNGSTGGPLWLHNNNVLCMHRIRDEHVVLICEEFDMENADADLIDLLEATWFIDDPQSSINAVIVHVPSHDVIERVRLPLGADVEGSIAFCSGADGTIGVGFSWKGVILTGANIRGVGSSESEKDFPNQESIKKKKLARQIYSRKKEGRRAPRCSS